MACDEARLLIGKADNLVQRRDIALHRASGIKIDEGKEAGEEKIAHMDDIGVGDVDDDVAIGVRIGKVQYFAGHAETAQHHRFADQNIGQEGLIERFGRAA